MLSACFLFLLSQLALLAAAQTPNCSCGYLDVETNQRYTEALIAYFNETDSYHTDFVPQNYSHKVEHGWNTIFRQAADASNVQIDEKSGVWFDNRTGAYQVRALDLLTQPATVNHLVYGGKIQSKRQDIQYGTFRAGMKSATQWTGGTALTIGVVYNSSQGLQMDFMNMDEPIDAGVSNLMNGEWPAYVGDLVTNYTTLNASGVDAWTKFIDVRMDWNLTNVQFWIADNITRSVTKEDRSLPLAAAPLEFKSWSTGDKTYMEGPPTGEASHSHVAYVRAFFNSSTWTAQRHKDYDQSCTESLDFCLTTDPSVRESTPYSVESTLRWEQHFNRTAIEVIAGIVAAGCSTLGVLALVNVFLRRSPLRKIYRVVFRKRSSKASSSSKTEQSQRSSVSDEAPSQSVPSGYATPLPAYHSGTQTPVPGYASNATAPAYRNFFSSPNTSGEQVGRSTTVETESASGLRPRDKNHSDEITVLPPINELERKSMEQSNPFNTVRPMSSEKDRTNVSVSEKGKGANVEVREAPEPVPLQPVLEHVHLPVKPEDKIEPVTGAIVANLPPAVVPKKRIDYLAGLVAVACIGVTLRHFAQTFWPWPINGLGTTQHYPKVEKWARIFIGAYAITQLWIGPFFLTATRFLSTNYLKNGNLEDIAKKLSRRAPRLFVPIIIIFTLEYFLVEMGLTGALQNLPSIGYSTWPYVVAPPSFGVYLNDLFQLAYLMPNAIPEVVDHYCIGVLWTVPIQLQFTYVVLIGAVIIRSVKTPWKRALTYAFIITAGWYARSWSACHWCGLALSDLDATFKWKKYLETHKVLKYTIIFGAFCGAAGAPMIAVFNPQWGFDTHENSIHPDFNTGLPIKEAMGLTYPDYNIPTFSILAFSIGLQILVELSSVVQWCLSIKLVLWLHPHIMTVYLAHGFIFWSLGSFVCVELAKIGTPYWACLLITLVVCYATIFLLATVLTPLMAVPTDASMRALDRWIKDDPVPKIRTTLPYNKALILDREGVEQNARGDAVAAVQMDQVNKVA